MGTLYLVRHGQASFGADDYDQLSALGERQCEQLGRYFAERGVRFEAALVGSLRRQAQSLHHLQQGLGSALDPQVWPGLNEYDSEAVIHTVHPGPLSKPTDAEQVRQHFRLLREGLARWMAGEVAPSGMPSFSDFVAGITAALDHVRRQHAGDVLLVSSGGPISTAVGQVLGTPASSVIELNMRIRNSSVTEFAFTPKRHMLVGYNAVPHLDHPERRSWVTYT
jgi:broad specificity phosphatase PhoE